MSRRFFHFKHPTTSNLWKMNFHDSYDANYIITISSTGFLWDSSHLLANVRLCFLKCRPNILFSTQGTELNTISQQFAHLLLNESPGEHKCTDSSWTLELTASAHSKFLHPLSDCHESCHFKTSQSNQHCRHFSCRLQNANSTPNMTPSVSHT